MTNQSDYGFVLNVWVVGEYLDRQVPPAGGGAFTRTIPEIAWDLCVALRGNPDDYGRLYEVIEAARAVRGIKRRRAPVGRLCAQWRRRFGPATTATATARPLGRCSSTRQPRRPPSTAAGRVPGRRALMDALRESLAGFESPPEAR